MNTAQIVHISLEIWGAIFCVICASYILIGKKYDTKRCVWMSTLMIVEALQLIGDSFAWTFRGNPSTLGWYMVRISNMCVFLSNDIIGIAYINYFKAVLSEKKALKKIYYNWIMFLACLGICAILISQFSDKLVYYFDQSNFYHRSNGYMLLSVVGALMTVSLIAIVFHHRQYLKRRDFISMSIYLVLPLVANIIQAFNYGISLMNISLVAGLIIMFASYEIDRTQILVKNQALLYKSQIEKAEYEKELANQKAELAQKKMELAQKQTEIMLAQIKPHFMFNALAAIEYLCKRNPDDAQNALHHFSRYLRINMDGLNNMELVDFQKELEYTKEYLWIEKMRYEERLQIYFDLQVTDFQLPSLTLQPIVENAVRHGIRRKAGGGNVYINSSREDNNILITVIDDGVGFDVNQTLDDGRVHIGLENVEERLKIMCSGSLTIHSECGKGTKAEIRIPS